ncbi:MAG: cob(I)yrinic acid a,c-diamide adenosyltransferase [Nanoarchaeota archaeon]
MVEQKIGIVQIYYGNGKGKTTAALGQAVRALGHRYRVHIVQFLKNGIGNAEFDYSGELKTFEKIPNFSFRRFGIGEWANQRATELQIEKQSAEVRKAFNYLLSCFVKDYDLIIADEILYAVQMNLLDEKEVVSLIRKKPKYLELILTGSHQAFPKIFQLADLVTEFRKIKHPYDSGILARKGIEY